MNKEDLLRELSQKVSSGEITRQEVTSRLGAGSSVTTEGAEGILLSHLSVTKILYILGAAIVIIGIVIFTAQIWDDIGSFGRILVTLGLGFLLTAIGSMLMKQKSREHIGPVFFFIGGVLIPGGAMVTLSEMSTGVVSLWPIAITFGAIFLFYLLLNRVHKNAVLTFFAIANGTAFVYILVEAIVAGQAHQHADLYAYLTMAVGSSYLFLAHSFREGWNNKLIALLYFFGSAGIFGAAFSQVFDTVLWELVYPILVMGGLFLSAYMRSRAILVTSTFSLLAYVTYITSEYFADSLGWPISLVVLGFVFIGLGYASISFNKKYINESS
jgi:hypothetical protein